MMQWWVGTSGYSYKEWKGTFYPHDLPDREMLNYYSTRLPAVEINNTFYRMPAAGLLDTWAAQVPTGFRFVLKAPRKITHARPLKDKGDTLAYLFKTASTLEDKLGAILFQLPPYLHRDAGLLAAFLEQVPAGVRTAFEFRHRSWFDEAVYGLLHEKDCALCCSDSENEALRQFTATAGWGYLRLRRPGYSQAELNAWAEKVASQTWEAVYVFFKHEAAGAGPELAGRFMAFSGELR